MDAKISIRTYQPADKQSILELLQLNTPRYFAPEEEKDLIHYLDHELEQYFVVESNNRIIGCGGINFADNRKTGKISWDILHPGYQGKGIGTILLEHRIGILKSMNEAEKICVRTSQLAWKFYEKNGFELIAIKKDYWAKGQDLYNMVYAGKK